MRKGVFCIHENTKAQISCAVTDQRLCFRYIDSTNLLLLVSALACHRCDPGSNPGVGMWQGSCGLTSKVGGFPQVLRFPPPRMTT